MNVNLWIVLMGLTLGVFPNSVYAQKKRVPPHIEFDVKQEGSTIVRFLVSIKYPEGAKLTLFVKDSNNNTLFKESLDADSYEYLSVMNFEKMPEGTYYFEVRAGGYKERVEVILTTAKTYEFPIAIVKPLKGIR